MQTQLEHVRKLMIFIFEVLIQAIIFIYYYDVSSYLL